MFYSYSTRFKAKSQEKQNPENEKKKEKKKTQVTTDKQNPYKITKTKTIEQTEITTSKYVYL